MLNCLACGNILPDPSGRRPAREHIRPSDLAGIDESLYCDSACRIRAIRRKRAEYVTRHGLSYILAPQGFTLLERVFYDQMGALLHAEHSRSGFDKSVDTYRRCERCIEGWERFVVSLAEQEHVLTLEERQNPRERPNAVIHNL